MVTRSTTKEELLDAYAEGAKDMKTTLETRPPSLVTKLAGIMGALPDVKPEGTNPHFGYKFISNTQVLGILRPRLAAAGIMVLPEVLSEEVETRAKSQMTKLLVKFTLVDGETGETLSGTALGYGDDAGDKGANKAYTAAQKNFLIKLFCIGGESDIEDDAETDKRAASTTNPPPVITASKAPATARGGKTKEANSVQVREVSKLSKELGLGPDGLASTIEELFEVRVELAPLEPSKSQMLATYLGEMSAEDIGYLISYLKELSEKEPTEEDPTLIDLLGELEHEAHA